MNPLHQNIYITYSNQRARDLKTSGITDVFDKIVTLDALILELFEKQSFATLIDEEVAIAIIYKIIQEHKIGYFDYLQSDSASLYTIYDFILKCHRNDVAFTMLLEGEKLNALVQIDRYLQAYKADHNIVDLADIERIIADSFDPKLLDAYSEIILDSFEIGEVSFVKSKKQERLLQKLSHCRKLLPPEGDKIAKIVHPAQELFDAIDEVKSAIKIARKLLIEGEEPDNILIVASDIAEYAPLYKLFLDEYGMQGYSSIATPLSHFYNSADERVQAALKSFKTQRQTKERLYEKLGLTFSKSVQERLKESIKIADEKIGIEITEPNQLLGLNKKYKHIVFIGTDINHFPPTSQDNFLYTYEDALQYFYTNNYFINSQTQLKELKRLCEKLYILTASYSGKRELSRSVLIGNHYDEKIDISDVQSINDLALQRETVIADAQQKKYFESIVSEEFTPYDGMGVENIELHHLSASQINKYLACPLAYLYANKVKVQAPKQSEEGFDAMEQGSLMHLCFELFGRAIKESKITATDTQVLYALMFEKSMEAYNHENTTKNIETPNIHHEIFLSQLQAGLQDEREKGLLAKFVDYYILHAKEFEYFMSSEFEKEFALDEALQPYELKNKEDKNYFIKGFIDRFDELDGHINIIDYKSKKMSSKIDTKKQEQVETLKDVQLALYILYASQRHPNKEHKAHLLSFKGDNPYYHFANLSTIEEMKDTVHYSQEYNEQLKGLIFEVRDKIKAGEFAFDNSDETACGYCDIRFMCHEGVLNKNKLRRV